MFPINDNNDDTKSREVNEIRENVSNNNGPTLKRRLKLGMSRRNLLK